MSEDKVQSKYIDKDPPLGTEPQLERKQNDYLAYLKEKLNFILATYGRRLTDADGHVNELVRTAAEFAVILSQKVGNDEIISSINQSAEQIKIQANRINLVGTTIVNGSLGATYQRIYAYTDYSQDDITRIQNFISGSITFTDADWDKYSVNGDGVMRMSDLIKIRNLILFQRDGIKNVVITISPPDSGYAITVDTEIVWPTDATTGTSVNTFRAYYDGETASVPRVDTTTVNPSYVGRYNGETASRFYGDFYPGQSINVNTNKIDDFVIEHGTTSSWNWRKWNSGFVECWRTRTIAKSSLANQTTWGSLYVGDISTLSYPFTFTSAPHEYVSPVGGSNSSYGNSFWIINAGATTGPTTTTTGKYQAVRATAFGQGVTIAYYACGYIS